MSVLVNHDGEGKLHIQCNECGHDESYETAADLLQELPHHLYEGHPARTPIQD